MKLAGIEGPVFVSVGRPDQLSLFLDKNPTVDRKSAFVDSSDGFDAYESVGFGNIGDLPPQTGLVNPGLSAGQWLSYLSNVGKLAPKFEGVKRLGGSFVVRGGSIVFQHSDSVPGDEVPVEEVLAVAGADS